MTGSAYIVEVSGEFVVDDPDIAHNTVAEEAVAEELGVETHQLDFEARLVDKAGDD